MNNIQLALLIAECLDLSDLVLQLAPMLCNVIHKKVLLTLTVLAWSSLIFLVLPYVIYFGLLSKLENLNKIIGSNETKLLE